MTQKDSPYIDNTGTIIIPFNADPKYHYWNGGQSVNRNHDRAKYYEGHLG